MIKAQRENCGAGADGFGDALGDVVGHFAEEFIDGGQEAVEMVVRVEPDGVGGEAGSYVGEGVLVVAVGFVGDGVGELVFVEVTDDRCAS